MIILLLEIGLIQLFAELLLEHLRWLYLRSTEMAKGKYKGRGYLRHPWLEPGFGDAEDWKWVPFQMLIRFLFGSSCCLLLVIFFFSSSDLLGFWYWEKKPSRLRHILVRER